MIIFLLFWRSVCRAVAIFRRFQRTDRIAQLRSFFKILRCNGALQF